MGYNFAYLLAHYQSLKSPRDILGGSVFAEMVIRCENIINLAIGTTDERNPHLTDHIYHIVAFSALILCRLVHNYEPHLRAANYDIAALDILVLKLIKWLSSIGLLCHAAPLLGRIVLVQFKKLRPSVVVEAHEPIPTIDAGDLDSAMNKISSDATFLYADIIGSQLLTEDNALDWPQWE